MRRFTILLLHCAIAPLVLSQDLVIIERAGPGLVPAMKTSFVSRYTGDLQFAAVLRGYPLLSGSPSAALMVGDALFVGENNCTDTVCAPRVVRHDPGGPPIVFESVLSSAAKSIRLSSRGDLVVATYGQVVRFDRFSGAALATYIIPRFDDPFAFVSDADLSGCTMAVALSPNIIAFGDVCGPASAWTSISVQLPDGPPYGMHGIRFLPDGTLLIGARDLYHLDRAGNVIRAYDTGQSTTCFVAVDRSAQEALLGCDRFLLRLDLQSGEHSAPVPIRHGIAVGSLGFVESEPGPGRRRSIRH